MISIVRHIQKVACGWRAGNALIATVLLAVFSGFADAQTRVAVELVLAVDASTSVDEKERQLQQRAYVAAFRDKDIHEAIVALGQGGLAVTYLEWSSLFVQEQIVDWRHLRTGGEATAFAEEIEFMLRLQPLLVQRGNVQAAR